MKLFLHLFTFFIYNTKITQVHTGIAVQYLQDKTCFHIGKKVSYTAFHKSSKNLCILQTNGKNHFICYYNTERDGAVPVLIISLLDHRHVNQNQRVIIFHFNTGTLFLIQRGSEIVYFNLKLLRNLKNLRCCRIRKSDPAAILRFLYFMNSTFRCPKHSNHDSFPLSTLFFPFRPSGLKVPHI